VQLQEHLEAFRAAGIGVVAMTYDPAEALRAFRERHGVEYPLLSDTDAASVKALGILNTEYQPGDSAYGIPYPGVFVIDGDGVIRAKVFVEPYAIRVDAAGVLRVARTALGLDDQPAGSDMR
jgi:peroxiredoxin